MNLIRCKSRTELDQRASEWCADNFKPNANVFVPAGNTPRNLYALWEKTRPTYLSSVKLLQIDDVLTGHKRRVFKKFFQETLPSYLNQWVPIIDGSDSGDLAILGLGLNGHVAFHEPEIPFSFYSGCVPLSPSTISNLGLEKQSWGISYGLQALLQTRAMLLLVEGDTKKEILNKVLREHQTLPATYLKEHSNLTIITNLKDD